ncbi:unnamed protein product [Didymodactylos carnosus]|uniref:Reverse transcriptase/retrotransposon-derived protein RNase H-like domain-containing protein n=1 Tax=Didymodactylos carnosus TaxID=1234261 RepID=A0A815C6B3_9BILA|nr:unnamed protein product [Didymodactylos carnosus]CAF4079784.1 unnamed protein product [Didymodactylos carnosus]
MWGDLNQTTEPLFLHYPNPTVPFILSADASVIGISGILRQTTQHGTRICYYKPRTLSAAEKRYDPMEREALAIYWSIKQLREYIGYFALGNALGPDNARYFAFFKLLSWAKRPT